MTFLGIALGVLLAVLYPVLKGYITDEFSTKARGLPAWVPKYAALVAFCLITATIVLAGFRSVKPDLQISFWVAVLMGFGYEASIEKLFVKPL